MYRKYTLTDEEDKEIEMKVYSPNNVISVVKYEIDVTLTTSKRLTDLISIANQVMTGNTINKIEIEEIDE